MTTFLIKKNSIHVYPSLMTSKYLKKRVVFGVPRQGRGIQIKMHDDLVKKMAKNG